MGQYYYLDGTDPIGPFNLQDVYTLIDREVVGPTTMVCRAGESSWQLLSVIPELTGKVRANASMRNSSSAAGSSGASSGSRRHRGLEINVTAVIIALLFFVVAIYVTYSISHQGQETTPEMDHLLGR